MASDGAGGGAGIGAEFELAGEQVIHAILVHDQHDEIGGLGADLQAETATADSEEGGCAPAFFSAATGNAFAITAADDEACVEQGRNHGHTFGRTEYFFGDTLVRGGLDFVEHGAGGLDASGSLGVGVGSLGVVVSIGGKNRRLETCQETNEQQNEEISHHASLGS